MSVGSSEEQQNRVREEPGAACMNVNHPLWQHTAIRQASESTPPLLVKRRILEKFQGTGLGSPPWFLLCLGLSSLGLSSLGLLAMGASLGYIYREKLDSSMRLCGRDMSTDKITECQNYSGVGIGVAIAATFALLGLTASLLCIVGKFARNHSAPSSTASLFDSHDMESAHSPSLSHS